MFSRPVQRLAASAKATRASTPAAAAPSDALATPTVAHSIGTTLPVAAPERGASPNRTGLPDKLKHGVETLSGIAMDDVRVHRNSPHPEALDAVAYAQGTDIHLGPGQEGYLPHEAWHIVQQKQGRVRTTGVAGAKTPLNDDVALERESDRMGAAAASHMPAPGAASPAIVAANAAQPVQLGKGDKKKGGNSSKANQGLVASMGKAATRVNALPNAKPHTKSGTGSSGTDHQGRNAQVIKKAKQDTRRDEDDPTMFSASRMRSDDNAVVKDKAANEARAEKKKTKAKSEDDDIRDFWGLGEDEEITKDHRTEYRKMNSDD